MASLPNSTTPGSQLPATTYNVKKYIMNIEQVTVKWEKLAGYFISCV